MAVKEKVESVSDEIEWNVDTEVQLFYAMHGHKPVGVNKYFQMACILEKFRNSVNKDISSKVIWDRLDTMYDMQALDDTENLPFPNEEKEFSLPDSDFASMMQEKTKSCETMETMEHDNVVKKEFGLVVNKGVKEVSSKKESLKDIKDLISKKEHKDTKESSKEIKKEIKETPKEPKKISNKDKDGKDSRRESKDSKDGKKEIKKETREMPKEVRRELLESKELKVLKSRSNAKEKKEHKKEDDREDVALASLTTFKKERVKELIDQGEDSPKRGGKRATRGSIKPDDTGSNKSSSPITVTPPPQKRRRT